MDFEFFLARKLSMTVQSLRESMTQREFVEWNIYFGRLAQQQELERQTKGG